MNNKLKIAAAMLSATWLVAGCGSTPETSQGKETSDYPTNIELRDGFDPDATFTWATNNLSVHWDPTESLFGSDLNAYAPVYDKLLEEEEDGSITPMLATEYKAADDGTSLTLKLREGLTFSDGTPFDADAVKFNLDRYRAQGSRIAGEVPMISSVDVVDGMTVRINVDGGLGALAVSLANRAGVMVSPTAVQSGVIKNQPVGVGPYVMTAMSPGDSITFERQDGYWDPDAQRVKTLKMVLIAEDQARYNALTNGEVDGAVINPDQLDDVEKAGLQVTAKPSSSFLYFILNTAKGPFSDPEVRKALNMAIDREGISQGLYEGHCTPQIQPFLEGTPGYSEKIGDGLDVFPYDPEAAKKIIDEKGAAGAQATMVLPAVTIYSKFAEVIQEQLADVGITVTVQPGPPGQDVEAFGLQKSAEMLSSVYTGMNDPQALQGRYLAPKALFNPGGASYSEMEAAAAEGADPVDPAERTPHYEDYMDAWVETPPHMVPVCMVHLSMGYSQDVSGVGQRQSVAPNLRGVAIDKQ